MKTPECESCGARHGLPGHPPACRRRVKHRDAERKTAADVDNGPHCTGLTPSDAKIPEGMAPGRSTTAGNNCLIHSLIQAVKPTMGWGEGEQLARQLRGALVGEMGCSESGFLSVGDWWRPILSKLGEDPRSYTLFTHTESAGAEKHGGGPNVIRILNTGFCHFVPLSANPLDGRGRDAGDQGPRKPKRIRRDAEVATPAKVPADLSDWNLRAKYCAGSKKGHDGPPPSEEMRVFLARNSPRIHKLRAQVSEKFWPAGASEGGAEPNATDANDGSPSPDEQQNAPDHHATPNGATADCEMGGRTARSTQERRKLWTC